LSGLSNLFLAHFHPQGLTECNLCDRGSYSDSAGSVNCTKAPIGTFTGSSGQTNSTLCPPGTYSNLPVIFKHDGLKRGPWANISALLRPEERTHIPSLFDSASLCSPGTGSRGLPIVCQRNLQQYQRSASVPRGTCGGLCGGHWTDFLHYV